MAHILVVDDEKNYRMVLGRLLEEAGHRVSVADNPYAGLEILARDNVALIISDLRMPRMDGLTFLRQVREEYGGGIPFLVMTAYATVETAIEAMKLGAADYLLKPFQNDAVLLCVEKALTYARLHLENQLLRRQVAESGDQPMLGDSAAIRHLRSDIARVAVARTSVLICGETGTGKELVARLLHSGSPRAKGPLVTLNCAAFAEPLLESELFGHERGAFTGAVDRKRGLLEVAEGGSLLLDEIGEFPLPLQPKLLRVLQERRFRRVGGTSEIECDVRVLAATHRDLTAMVTAGTFRADLLYRLNVVILEVPPLRTRREDIPLLAQAFLQRFAREFDRPPNTLSAEAMVVLQAHDWPGNIRELQNVIERGALFCDVGELGVSHLPDYLSHQPGQQVAVTPPLRLDRPLSELLDDYERQLIRSALVQARGVQAQAAQLLGISRSNLQYKLNKLGL
jgi:two-component system NtrC family response regulator